MLLTVSRRLVAAQSYVMRVHHHHRRALSSNTSNNREIVNRPSSDSASTTWERGAIAVKNTDVTNPYLEAIRAEHAPSMHIKTIEDELKGTIGKALGRQGDKILRAVRQMEAEFQNYQQLCEKYGAANNDKQDNTDDQATTPPSHPEVTASARKFNGYRAEALQARWELTVHRQAAGFIVNNHKYVMEQYPIAEALPIASSSTNSEMKQQEDKSKEKKKSTKKFTDQLDWWQRIGRWR